MRAKLSAALSLTMCLAAFPPAAADRRGAADPRDTDGPLDMVRIRQSHGRVARGGKPRLRFTIRTEGTWRNRRLKCGQSSKCRSLFDIYVTTDRDEDYERQIQVYKRGGRVRVGVTRYTQECVAPGTLCNETSGRVGWGRYWRRDRRGFIASIPVRYLGRDVKRYGWRVRVTFFRDEACEENSAETPGREFGDFVCWDYAPEVYGSGTVGWLWHRL